MTEQKIDIQQHIQTVREALSLDKVNTHIAYQLARRRISMMAPTWLQHSIEIIEQQQSEIESLRSQLAQAERERDELRRERESVEGWKDLSADTATELLKQTEANTALLNGLRWYGDTKIYESELVQREIEAGDTYYANPYVMEDGGAEARRILAQYDKE